VSGALAERDFVAKLERAGFSEIEVLAREPLSIDDCALYPLFDEQLLALMRSVIDSDKQHAVGIGVIFRARQERKVVAV
jgi:arsenite methyltransferase